MMDGSLIFERNNKIKREIKDLVHAILISLEKTVFIPSICVIRLDTYLNDDGTREEFEYIEGEE
jgi:hypothetical protein